MERLKKYFQELLKSGSYRGWHLVQAEKTTHKSITNALLGIKKLAKDGIFLATDENLKKLNREMRGEEGHGSARSMRKQVLVNLETIRFIKRKEEGQKTKVELTEKALEYLDYGENKEFYMDEFLANFEMKKERLEYAITPYPILMKILADLRIKFLSFKEFQYFISQIRNEAEIEEKTELVLVYRQLNDNEKKEIDEFVYEECVRITREAEKQSLPKEYKRDYKNWINNAKHSLEFFNLGSQIKFYGNEVRLLLGDEDFKKKILEDLRKIESLPRAITQKIYFRDKKIMNDLKKLYGYYCQFCGYNFSRIPTRHGFYIEASHIVPVSEQKNYKDIEVNSPKNVVITCPNHHKMIDVHYPPFKKRIVVFEDGKKGLETTDGAVRLYLTLNEHL